MFDPSTILPLLMANMNQNDTNAGDAEKKADDPMAKMQQMMGLINAMQSGKNGSDALSSDALLEMMAAGNPSLAQNMQLFKMLPMLMQNKAQSTTADTPVKNDEKNETFAQEDEDPDIIQETISDNGINYEIYRKLKDKI